MNAIPVNVLHSAAQDAGLEIDAVYEEYSGRGMYGERCIGIVHSNINELLAFVLSLPEDEQELLMEHRANQDNMGTSMITYWPALQSARVQ